VNLSVSEIRSSYAKLSDPSCTPLASLPAAAASSRLWRNDGNDGNATECTKWIYDNSFLYGFQSMTADLGWVCQNAWKNVMGQSTYFLGSVMGTLIFGILSDSHGRLLILIISHACAIIGNAMTIFAADEVTFAICRFVSGLATDSNFMMMYLLVLEYIRPQMRTFGLNLCIGIFYCLGSVMTPWLAVWLGNWKLYLLATVLPALVVPFFYFTIVESAQWLLSKQRYDEALICYQRIASFNGKPLDEDFIRNFKHIVAGTAEKAGPNDANPNMIALFKTPRLRRLTLILFFKS